MKADEKARGRAALEVLRGTGVSILDVALVGKAALHYGRGGIRLAVKCLKAGAEEL
ncbi:MAG: hypothetical protein IKA23_04655 [Akkermansia sp.]|nr:hypothetical protein [Akkermansia sp.]